MNNNNVLSISNNRKIIKLLETTENLVNTYTTFIHVHKHTHTHRYIAYTQIHSYFLIFNLYTKPLVPNYNSRFSLTGENNLYEVKQLNFFYFTQNYN